MLAKIHSVSRAQFAQFLLTNSESTGNNPLRFTLQNEQCIYIGAINEAGSSPGKLCNSEKCHLVAAFAQ